MLWNECARLPESGWLNSSCLDRPLAFVGVVRLCLKGIGFTHTNLTFVCDVRSRVREAVRPELKKSKTFLSLHRWTWTIHEAVH